MRRFKEKLKEGFDQIQERVNKEFSVNHNNPSSIPAPVQQARSDTTQAPTEQDIFRYRKQRGVNLGSWFVLERWIAESPFRNAAEPAQSDLDVARGSNAKQILEQHWDTWVVEEDWRWIKERGLNGVRIPIGYYHLTSLDPSIIQNTDFAPYHDVFSGAWSRISNAIEIAYKHGLGILIDLHAAPGSQNPDSHSGTSNPPAFFSHSRHQQHTIHILRILLLHITTLSLPNIIGIQLLNEPHPPSDSLLMSWYTDAITSLRSIDPSIPIYLGECWKTKEYVSYVTQNPNHHALTVLDHHLYRCFTSSDISTPTSAHCSNLSSFSSSFSSFLEPLGRSGSGIIIGEWSGALNPGSLRGSWGDEQRKWINAQLEVYESDVIQGWFFWTFKKQQPGDWGWSLRDSVGGGVFPSFIGLPVRVMDLNSLKDKKESEKKSAYGSHVGYWSNHGMGGDHRRYAEGFDKGWDDALVFLSSSISSGQGGGSTSELGFTRAYAMRRTENHGEGYWEFEHGYVEGVRCARGVYASTSS